MKCSRNDVLKWWCEKKKLRSWICNIFFWNGLLGALLLFEIAFIWFCLPPEVARSSRPECWWLTAHTYRYISSLCLSLFLVFASASLCFSLPCLCLLACLCPACLCLCLPLPAFACLCLPAGLFAARAEQGRKTHGNLGWQEPRTKKPFEYLLFEKTRFPNLQKDGFVMICRRNSENSWKTLGGRSRGQKIYQNMFYLKECVCPTFKKREKSWNLGCQESRTKKLCEYLLLKKRLPNLRKAGVRSRGWRKTEYLLFLFEKVRLPNLQKRWFCSKPEKNLWKIAGDRSRGKNN